MKLSNISKLWRIDIINSEYYRIHNPILNFTWGIVFKSFEAKKNTKSAILFDNQKERIPKISGYNHQN